MTTPPIDTHWDFDDPAGSEARFRELLPSAGGVLRAELLTRIARAQGLQRRFEEGHRTLDEAEALLSSLADPGRARIRGFLERGRLFNSAGDGERAISPFLAAWEEARRAGDDDLAVDAAHMLGIAGPAGERLSWNLRALDLAEQSSDPAARRWVGPLLNNLGWTHFDVGDHGTALDVFERALDWRQERGQTRETRTAGWAVARTLRALDRVNEALAIQEGLKTELVALGESDPYVDEELGECLLALGRLEDAYPYLTAAYDVLSRDPWFVENEAPRLARWAALIRGGETSAEIEAGFSG